MNQSKQILIRLPEAEHAALAVKAKASRISVQRFIREAMSKLQPSTHDAYLRLENLLLARISTQLAAIAERCQNLQDPTGAVHVIAHLVSIEEELRKRAVARRSVC
jgi:hypothetical protein